MPNTAKGAPLGAQQERLEQAVRTAEHNLATLTERRTSLAAERAALEGLVTETRARVASVDAARGPAARSGDRGRAAELHAEREAASRECADAELALRAVTDDETEATASVLTAERVLHSAQLRVRAFDAVALARRFDALLTQAESAFAEVIALTPQLGHVLRNSIVTGGVLWGDSPSLAKCVDCSGRSEARSLASLLRQALGHLLTETDDADTQ